MWRPATAAERSASAVGGRRRLSIARFLAIVVVYLAIVKGVGALVESGLDGFDGHFRTSQQIVLALLVPIGLSVVFVYAVVAALGWWARVCSAPCISPTRSAPAAPPSAQAIAVSFAGYFFYLTRRVSGGLVVPAVLHGLFDFSILSGTVIDDRGYAGGIAAILAYPVVAVILLMRRHRIEPTAEPGRPAAAGST